MWSPGLLRSVVFQCCPLAFLLLLSCWIPWWSESRCRNFSSFAFVEVCLAAQMWYGVLILLLVGVCIEIVCVSRSHERVVLFISSASCLVSAENRVFRHRLSGVGLPVSSVLSLLGCLPGCCCWGLRSEIHCVTLTFCCCCKGSVSDDDTTKFFKLMC